MTAVTDPASKHGACLAAVVADNIAALTRARGVLENLPAGAFTAKSALAFNASVGEHFRHLIEHYRIFLGGVGGGVIDYDARPRDAKIETDAAAAVAAIDDLCRRLQALPTDTDAAVAVTHLTSVGGRGSAAAPSPLGAPAPSAPSCISRELLFLHHHATHHFAFVTIILNERGITTDADLGVAPATLAHRRR